MTFWGPKWKLSGLMRFCIVRIFSVHVLGPLDTDCRAEGALTFECHRRTRSTLIFVCPRVTLIFGFSEIFEFFLTEMEWVHHFLDATVGPVAAP